MSFAVTMKVLVACIGLIVMSAAENLFIYFVGMSMFLMAIALLARAADIQDTRLAPTRRA